MRRGRARKKQQSPDVSPPERGLHAGPTAPYAPLTDAEVARLIDTTVDLLESSGVVFERGGEAEQIFLAAGCQIDEQGVTRIPASVTRAALETCAKSTRLFDRNGENPITIDCDHTWFMPGMTCINAYDLDTGESRPSTREDLALATRLADALPEIDGVCIAMKNVAQSDQFGEIDEFACMMENTIKPLEYLCEFASSLEAVIDMAAAVRGGQDALRDKPYFLHIITPLPVNFANIHSDQIITATRAGIPACSGTLSIGAASSPITLAGCLVHSLMTDFAAMVLGQLAQPGCFCVGCSDVNFMEPATGAIGSFAQTSLADAAACQIRRTLGFPSLTGTGGCSVAQRFNQDAVFEISSNMTQAFYSRPATMDYCGSLDQGLTYSLHALLLCNDMAALLRKMWEGARIGDDQMAIEQIKEVGPTGNFLALQHTVDNCRTQVWNSRYFGANIPLSNNGMPDLDLIERLDADLQSLLAELDTPALPETVAARVGVILDAHRHLTKNTGL